MKRPGFRGSPYSGWSVGSDTTGPVGSVIRLPRIRKLIGLDKRTGLLML